LKISQAFDKTLKNFGINARQLSEQSGVSEKMISLFRNNRQRIYSDSFEKLLDALPLEARLYFLIQLSEGKLAALDQLSEADYIKAKWKSLIFSASLADIEIILRALADRHGELKAKNEVIQLEEESTAWSA
jgi:transcriptional regulator with XRE-family HTH domain